MTETCPLTAFGLITDIQYADTPDVLKDGAYRYYRNGLNLVKNAVSCWQTYEKINNTKLKFILQLGDLIDGKAKSDPHTAMNKVLSELENHFSTEELRSSTDSKLLHIWGNHEMYNFKRDLLIKTPLYTRGHLMRDDHGNKANYYSLDLTEKLALICLDYYEYSVIGHEDDDIHFIKAMQLIKSHNKNENLNDSSNLPDDLVHMCAYNGGLHGEQFDWLKDQLKSYQDAGKKTIICGHMPICIEASHKKNMPLNHIEIRETICQYPNVCIAYLAGHTHKGGVFKDDHGIFHLTQPGIVETKPGSNSFSIVQVFKEKLRIEFVTNNTQIFEIDI